MRKIREFYSDVDAFYITYIAFVLTLCLTAYLITH